MNEETNRRPLKSRSSSWARVALNFLLKTGITPNTVSVLSIVAAGVAAFGFLISAQEGRIFLLLAAFGIQARLLCNLLDGMLAVEGQRASKVGELFNEIPDRISDIIILVAAGYSYRAFSNGCSMDYAWWATIGALCTAYIRVFGASVGAGHIFLGPMAKPHRMALLTACCLIEVALDLLGAWRPLIPTGLLIIAVGCVVTIIRRLHRIATYLKNKA